MNPSPPTNEPIRVALRHIRLASFLKWLILGWFVWGIFSSMLCTAWYAIDGQLTRRTILWYFPVMVLFYAIPGLIGSIIVGATYNSAARKLGGVEFDIVLNSNVIPPPPPEHWEGTLPKIKAGEPPGRA